MIHFECDYNEGAHPEVMKALVDTNFEQNTGYGLDPHCAHARELIQKACGCTPDVHFLVGGTQTNMTVIDFSLRSGQGVIAAATGHINVHETGAIESMGHKVLVIPTADGKLHASDIETLCANHFADPEYEHTVPPGMVYISNPAENGLIYSLQELTAIHEVCKKYSLPLFLDGARLGFGFAADTNNLTLNDLCRLCDVFYIGGTKQGALFGEAVVFPNLQLAKNFRYSIKQHGGMLAKGRLLGVQFETLFTNDLYMKISRKTVSQALRIRKALIDKGYKMWNDSHTNQQFVYLDDAKIAELSKEFSFEIWGKAADGKHKIVRFCTSWATPDENIDKLISAL